MGLRGQWGNTSLELPGGKWRNVLTGDEISGPEVASELKGRHLMVEPIAQSLGLEGAPTAG